MSLKKRFDRTRSSRNKFNVIFATFIAAYLIVWSLEFIYASIVLSFLGSSFLIENITSSYLLVVNIAVSSYFAYKSYYWHYLKNMISVDYSSKAEEKNKSFPLTFSQNVDMFAFIAYKITPIILTSSTLFFLLIKKDYIGGLEFTVFFSGAVYFMYSISRKMYRNIDREVFTGFEYKGNINDFEANSK